MLDELEDFLIQSDVGTESAKDLRDKFASTKINPKISGKEEIFQIFSNYISFCFGVIYFQRDGSLANEYII